MELYVQLSVKVLHNCYSESISNFESSILGALPSQFLDETLSIGVVCTIWSGDLHVLEEILETYALAVGNLARGEGLWLPTFTKKVEAQ